MSGRAANVAVTDALHALDRAFAQYLGEPVVPSLLTYAKNASRTVGAQIARLEAALRFLRFFDLNGRRRGVGVMPIPRSFWRAGKRSAKLTGDATVSATAVAATASAVPRWATATSTPPSTTTAALLTSKSSPTRRPSPPPRSSLDRDLVLDSRHLRVVHRRLEAVDGAMVVACVRPIGERRGRTLTSIISERPGITSSSARRIRLSFHRSFCSSYAALSPLT